MAHEIAQLAQAMLEGDLHYLLGAERLIELRERHGVYVNDPDFIVFVAVVRELHELRDSGIVLPGDEKKERVVQSVDWAKAFSQCHCEALLRRYS